MTVSPPKVLAVKGWCSVCICMYVCIGGCLGVKCMYVCMYGMGCLLGEDGISREPYEEVVVDVDPDLQGLVIESMVCMYVCTLCIYCMYVCMYVCM